MWAIFKREMKSYFLSATGYVFLAIFYLFSGFFFYETSILSRCASLKYVFSNLLVILIFLIPMLTMRSMSEDKKLKIDQLLLTSPVNLWSIVCGKFFAAFVTFFCGVAVTFIYAGVISYLAPFDWLSFICDVIGVLFLGSALISIGIFASSLTENQIIAAVSSCAAILLLFFMENISSAVNIEILSTALSYLSIVGPYSEFTYGCISLPGVVLFLGLTAIFLFLSTRILEKRRWSK